MEKYAREPDAPFAYLNIATQHIRNEKKIDPDDEGKDWGATEKSMFPYRMRVIVMIVILSISRATQIPQYLLVRKWLNEPFFFKCR